MPQSRRRKSQPVIQPFLRRLEDAAENLNPILIVIIIGLGILNFSVFAALELRNLPLRPISAAADDAPATPIAFGPAMGLRHR